MERRLRRLAVPLACLALLALTTQANAAFSLTLTQSGGAFNGTTMTLTDGGVGDLSGAGDGIIMFAGAFGDFVFDMATVRQMSDASTAMLQSTEFAVRNGASGAVTLSLQTSSDPFTTPKASGDTLFVQSTLASSFISPGPSNTSDAGATYASKIDSTALDDLTIKSTVTPVGIGTGMLYTRGESFTLSSNLSLTLYGGGSAQVVGTTMTAVPQPASALLMLIGIPVIGLGRRWFGRRGPARMAA